MKILFVRHGLTEANERRLYYGSTDVPLCSRGIMHLEGLRDGYGQIVGDLGEVDFYSSGMKRTNSTLEILFPGAEYRILEGLREMDFGQFEMHSYQELKDKPEYISWIEGDVEVCRCPDGESPPDVVKRATEALAPLVISGKNCVCVSHGGTIACLLMHYFPKDGDRSVFTPDTASWAEVEYDVNGEAVAFRLAEKKTT